MLTAIQEHVLSMRVLSLIHSALVLGNPLVVNRDYEPDVLQHGDGVSVPILGAVAAPDDYVPYGPNTVREPSASTNSFDIDQSKAVFLGFDVVDLKQARLGAGLIKNQQLREKAYSFGLAADAFLAGKIAAGADADNVIDAADFGGAGGAAIVLDGDTRVYDLLVEAAMRLDEANVPTTGRYAAIGARERGSLILDNLVTNGPSDRIAETAFEQASIGQVAGFNILNTNVLPGTVANHKILYGHSWGTTWAEQLTDHKVVDANDFMGIISQSVHLYGAKVLRPEFVGTIQVNATAAATRSA